MNYNFFQVGENNLKNLFCIIVAVVCFFATAFLFLQIGIIKLPGAVKDDEIAIGETFTHKKLIEHISGYRQVIDIIEVHPKDSSIGISLVLSHDNIFGFEKTSAIAERTKSKAAINGGFFHEYGEPSGFTVINGRLIRTPRFLNRRPVFLIDAGNRAQILDIDIELFVRLGSENLIIQGVNKKPERDEIIVFTPEYGLSTRTESVVNNDLDADGFSYIVIHHEGEALKDKIQFYPVSGIGKDIDIPRNGMVIVATRNKASELLEIYEALFTDTYSNLNSNLDLPLNLDRRDKIDIVLSYNTAPNIGEVPLAFEGGFWVVKNGVKVIKEYEAWVGLTTNREPRSVIGLKDDNTVVLMTIDGRQPGYSIGVTGEELADYLIKAGINNALMLDGGASTTMVVDGKVVNKPSYRGRERAVGGAICIKGK